MPAALTQRRRTRHHQLGGRKDLFVFEPEGGGDIIGGQLAGARYGSRKTPFDADALLQDAAQHLFDHGLAVFKHKQGLALGGKTPYGLHRQRILRDFQHRIRTPVLEALHYVIVGYAAGYYA